MTRRTRLSIEALDGRCLPSFSPVTSFPAGADPRTVVTADFNNDGHLDLATANSDPATRSSGVSVLLGDGRGGFGTARHSAGGASGGALAAGDFNSDGKLDLVTTHSYDVRVRLGNGDGTFQSPFAVTTGNGYFSVGVSDLNADQKMDLVVTSSDIFSGTGYIEVLLGNGAGAFTTSRQWDEPSYGSSLLAIDDLNTDGTPDLVFGDGYWISVWLGYGNGAFGPFY